MIGELVDCFELFATIPTSGDTPRDAISGNSDKSRTIDLLQDIHTMFLLPWLQYFLIRLT